MKKSLPEEYLFKLKWERNGAAGKEGLECLEEGTADMKAPSTEAALEKLKKSSVSEATWARSESGRKVFHSSS